MTTAAINSKTPTNPLLGGLQRNWGWLLTLGIAFIVLGLIGLGMLFALTVVSVLFFGFLLLIGGGLQLLQAFHRKGWKDLLLHVLIAILYLLAGILAITDPIAASTAFTLLLAGILIAIGITRIIMAVRMRTQGNWLWPLLGGVVSLILGSLIFVQWPVSGLWVIGLFVAIELIVNGWSYIFIALAAKKATL
ncbi:MAG: HdeD family acid-resistance protein [Candidatus Competibacteraceae bacterium]|nr:HdeD family acid-resistance protein [Candidatus Competibacteraceae bacterium]